MSAYELSESRQKVEALQTEKGPTESLSLREFGSFKSASSLLSSRTASAASSPSVAQVTGVDSDMPSLTLPSAGASAGVMEGALTLSAPSLSSLMPRIYGRKDIPFSDMFPSSYQKMNNFTKKNMTDIALIANTHIHLLLLVLKNMFKLSTDPHVGETACQIRAILFAFILNLKNGFIIEKSQDLEKSRRQDVRKTVSDYQERVTKQWFFRKRTGHLKLLLLNRFLSGELTFEAFEDQVLKRRFNRGHFVEVFNKIRLIPDFLSDPPATLIFSDSRLTSEFQEMLISLQSNLLNSVVEVESLQAAKLKKINSLEKCLQMLLKTEETPTIPTWELIFLSMAHGLSDPTAPNEGSLNPRFLEKQLALIGNEKVAKKLAQELQVSLSEISVDFIVERAAFHKDSKTHELLSTYKGRDEIGRSILPMYFLTKVLQKEFENLQPNIEIFLKKEPMTAETSALDMGQSLHQTYIFEDGKYVRSANVKGGRVVFEGIVPAARKVSLASCCDNIMKSGPFNNLLLLCACHPQMKLKSVLSRLIFLTPDQEREKEQIEDENGLNEDPSLQQSFVRQLFLENHVAYTELIKMKHQGLLAQHSRAHVFLKHIYYSWGESARTVETSPTEFGMKRS